ncbi:MAG: thioesterase [Eubacteriales bacterium]|nr:thioesterase [Eubacteriales bacterium]
MDTLTREHIIKAAQCDRFGRLSPHDMLLLMQETVGEHTALLNLGRETLAKENAVWVLVSQELQVLKYPKYMDKISITVYPTAPRRTLFPRYVMFDSDKGERLINAVSLWTLMDIDTLSMVKIPWVESAIPKNKDKTPPMRYPSRANSFSENTQEIIYSPKFSDFDLNGHINNTRCVLWLTDILGEDILYKHPLERITINYNREIRGKEDITLRLAQLAQSENKFSLSCTRGDLSHIDIEAQCMQDNKDTVSSLAFGV